MSGDQSTDQRLTRLETEMVSVKSDVAEIKQKLGQTATKQDLEGIKEFFTERDRISGDRMWQITRSLLWIFGAVVLVAFGIERVPNLWGG